MRRNLDRRIEAVTPIEDINLKIKLYKLLKTYLNDNYFAWIMKEDGKFGKKSKDTNVNRSQIDLVKTWQNY